MSAGTPTSFLPALTGATPATAVHPLWGPYAGHPHPLGTAVGGLDAHRREEGTEPPDWIKELYEIDSELQAVNPNTKAAEAAYKRFATGR